MKKKFLYPGLIVLISALILIFSCPNDDGIGSPGNEDPLYNYMVKDLDAGTLERIGEIHLSWTSIVGVESYNIYRYISKIDLIPDETFIKTDETPQIIEELDFVDDTVTDDTPYFYKIACEKLGSEYDCSGFVFGICTDSIDRYEKNNEWAKNVTNNFPIDTHYLYYLPDTGDGELSDTDWYRYEGIPQLFHVDITPNASTDFDSGQIRLLFRYYFGNDEKREVEYPINNSGTTECHYGNTGDYPDNPEVTDTIVVYFKIFIDEAASGLPIDNTVEDYELDLVIGM